MVSKKKSKKKLIIVLAIIAVVIIAAVLVVPRFFGPMAGMGAAPAVASATVQKGTISTTVESSGNIDENEIEIAMPYDVAVYDILVDEGDYVSDGDKIATIYSYSIENKIDEVEDEIEDLNDKIKDQKGNSSNVKALKERKSEFSSIKKALEKVAKKDAIYASGNGTVKTISISEGSSLTEDETSETTDTTSTETTDTTSASTSSSSDSSMSITSLRDDYFGTGVTIDSNDTMALEVDIDELDISTLKTGLEAEVVLDAIEDKTFTGKVTKINSTVSVGESVVKYSAKIELEKANTMKTGMSASATIVKESKKDVLKIPVDAVQENAEGLFVYTSNEDDTLGGIVKITTGLSDGNMVEVLTGLSEGKTVYYTQASSGEDAQMMMQQGGFGGGGAGGGGERQMPEGGNEAPEGFSPPSNE